MLDDGDFERLGKFLDNAIERRFAAFEQTYHADQVAIIQEMQAMEARLRSEVQAMEARLRSEVQAMEARLRSEAQAMEARLLGQINSLAKEVALARGDIADLQARSIEMQQVIARVYETQKEHGAMLYELSDSLKGLYRCEIVQDDRLARLEALLLKRPFPPGP